MPYWFLGHLSRLKVFSHSQNNESFHKYFYLSFVQWFLVHCCWFGVSWGWGLNLGPHTYQVCAVPLSCNPSPFSHYFLKNYQFSLPDTPCFEFFKHVSQASYLAIKKTTDSFLCLSELVTLKKYFTIITVNGPVNSRENSSNNPSP